MEETPPSDYEHLKSVVLGCAREPWPSHRRRGCHRSLGDEVPIQDARFFSAICNHRLNIARRVPRP